MGGRLDLVTSTTLPGARFELSLPEVRAKGVALADPAAKTSKPKRQGTRKRKEDA
jgi:hypothetical protein